MRDDLNVLVVDDTITYRHILSKIVSSTPNAKLAGVSSNEKYALSKIELSQPDLVLLDIAVSGKDGIETLERIKNVFPDIEVVMISGLSCEDADITVKALEAGALDFVPKPQEKSHQGSVNELTKALAPILQLAITRKHCRRIKEVTGKIEKNIQQNKSARPAIKPLNQERKIPKKSSQLSRVDVVAMGVSTGGPNALMQIIPRIARDFPVPILAVQHMPPMFITSLTKRLDMRSSIRVIEARQGLQVEKGAMYIAPGGVHMVVHKDPLQNIALGLVNSQPINSCRPAVDVLFRSVGKVYGGNVLTVILTGMGKDGASGVASIRRKGGYSIVQDESTSVIWGMPGEVDRARDADEILPLEKIAVRITEIVKRGKH